MEHLVQTPQPGERRLTFCGDTITFTLADHSRLEGTAWLRTNMGRAAISRKQIIRAVDHDVPALGEDWFDVPMHQNDAGHFKVVLPLTEVGHFEAKAYFLEKGDLDPIWPDGANTTINVEPASCCAANTIYNAFVRQFGRSKTTPAVDPVDSTALKALDEADYAVIPPSGTFRDLIGELDFVCGTLGCRILQLMPVTPTPTTYGRLGRYGSPYAALSFFTVDPALAEFDAQATPLEQFMELVDAVHTREARLFLDIAVNHTGWAADLHSHHPEWLSRDKEGRIERPGAWGVVWADLARLDYSHRDLWRHVAEVFLAWCKRGVDGFRCDAGYMIPLEAWRYMIARVRDEYPDVVFFLEGLGGPPETTQRLLNEGGFDWAYSELFQNHDRGHIESYLPDAFSLCERDGTAVHFAETHDNTRMAAVSLDWARHRTTLSALLSHQGAFGFTNGVEWFATDRINVHESASLNWGAEENQVAGIASLNRLLRTHSAFHHPVSAKLVQTGEGNYLALARRNLATDSAVLILANLDISSHVKARWTAEATPGNGRLFDLLSGREIAVGPDPSLDLDPGEILCLSPEPGPETPVAPTVFQEPQRVRHQRLRSKVLQALVARDGFGDMAALDVDELAIRLGDNPDAFCDTMLRAGDSPGEEPRVTRWNWPRDLRRVLMLPPGHFLLLRCPHPFRVCVSDGGHTVRAEDSIASPDGQHFILIPPLPVPSEYRSLALRVSVYGGPRAEHKTAAVLLLATGAEARIHLSLSRQRCATDGLTYLGTNGRGAMLRSSVRWGFLTSRYDGLLAANLDKSYPVDRRMMVARFRMWLVYQGYSHELGETCLERFAFSYDSRATWTFRTPTGQGHHVTVSVSLNMIGGENEIDLWVTRGSSQGADELDAADKITVIIRPDIEDRSFHKTTKAHTGPERLWPGAVSANQHGFVFAPSPRAQLEMVAPNSGYTHQPEWLYMVHREIEAQRGLDPDSDLFSPGYFTVYLAGGEEQRIRARATVGREPTHREGVPPTRAVSEDLSIPLEEGLAAALRQYVVNRGPNRSVIAGYPWFLDWGRDTLIVTRGIIAAGHMDVARSILLEFARFAKDGTLPNMIRGDDATDRDTSDAPLWFFVACSDLVQAEGNSDFLDLSADGRTVGQTLEAMANALVAGASNGVVMDPASGLLFSPTHFTWMDTNYPAGTPREGYPVEIQALWYASLTFLAGITGDQSWDDLADKVSQSIIRLYYTEERGFLSDCLHCGPGTAATDAKADDALRPNQLLALTLGAISDRGVAGAVLRSCEELLVPGAIRSLADRRVDYPLAVEHNGTLLNDPNRPYWGTYGGDEDTQRKPAYHNGTAWTWQFPLYAEAWVRTYGNGARRTARAWLTSSLPLLHSGCLGHIPELLDGDAPHHQRGCDAQAWGVSELLRVWLAVR